MEIAPKVYYAIESLLFLYSCESDAPWNSVDVAKVVSISLKTKSKLKPLGAENTPEDFRRALKEIPKRDVNNLNTITVVLKTLSRKGLITGIPGRGYEINNAGKQASIYDIVTSFEPVGLTGCTRKPATFSCPKMRSTKCSSFHFYKALTALVVQIFKKTTIASLVQGSGNFSDLLTSFLKTYGKTRRRQIA